MNEQTTQNERVSEHVESVDVGSTGGELIIQLINLMGKVLNPLRIAPGVIDTEIMTAAVTYAGCVHGELIAMGLMDEGTQSGDEAVRMFLHNYGAGVDAGKAKVARVKEQHDAKASEQEGQ
jgi:hypothetical protein